MFLTIFSSSGAAGQSPTYNASFDPIVSANMLNPAFFAQQPGSLAVTQAQPGILPAAVKSPVLDIPSYADGITAKPQPLSDSTSVARPVTQQSKFTFGSSASRADGVVSGGFSEPSPGLTRVNTGVMSPPRTSKAGSCSIGSYVAQSKLTYNLSVLLATAVVNVPTTFT